MQVSKFLQTLSVYLYQIEFSSIILKILFCIFLVLKASKSEDISINAKKPGDLLITTDPKKPADSMKPVDPLAKEQKSKSEKPAAKKPVSKKLAVIKPAAKKPPMREPLPNKITIIQFIRDLIRF